MTFSQLSFCSWHQIQINSEESPQEFYSRMMNFVLDHSAPEEMRDLVNDKNNTMSISILNLVAVEWMYRINIDSPRKVEEHFTDQLQDGKTSLAKLVPKIIEQLGIVYILCHTFLALPRPPPPPFVINHNILRTPSP